MKKTSAMFRPSIFMLCCGFSLVSHAAPAAESCIWAGCPDLKTYPWHTGILVGLSEKFYFGANTLGFGLLPSGRGELSRCTPETPEGSDRHIYRKVADGRAGDYIDFRIQRDQGQLAAARVYKSVYGIVRVVDEQVLRAKQIGVYKDNCFFGKIDVPGYLKGKGNTQVVESVEKIDSSKAYGRAKQQFLKAWNVLVHKSKTTFQAELLFLPYFNDGLTRIDWTCGSERGLEKVSALHISFSIPNPSGVPIRVPVFELDYVTPVAISRGTFQLGWAVQHTALDSLKVKMHYTCTSNKKVWNRTYETLLPGKSVADLDQ